MNKMPKNHTKNLAGRDSIFFDESQTDFDQNQVSTSYKVIDLSKQLKDDHIGSSLSTLPKVDELLMKDILKNNYSF